MGFQFLSPRGTTANLHGGGGSSATAYLVQFLGRKELILGTNSINYNSKYIIIGGLNYISLYIFILIIQLSISPIMQTLGKIRGKKSGLSPQRNRWNFSEVDLPFYGREF